jgi:hypothetical protein
LALATPAATVPMPGSATSLTQTGAVGLIAFRSKINCARSSIYIRVLAGFGVDLWIGGVTRHGNLGMYIVKGSSSYLCREEKEKMKGGG